MQSRETAAVLAPLLGEGVQIQPCGAELITHRDHFLVTLDGPQSLDFRMIARGHQGAHVCDGVRLLEPATVAGVACGCPPTWRQRRAASRAGQGPKPEITVRFRLAEALEIGYFDLVSSSWTLIKDIEVVAAALRASGSPPMAWLGVDRGVFTTAEGVEVTGRWPTLRLPKQVRDHRSP
ncbi:hypothetical protein Kpho02_72410 [Kitasatospora phosalacinea]|uniref:Uncharacterized protein n=1 Tax=Kitasatospora phosalacinea TaxID=2065 RepID=A0A9W6V400_9ACTN|nr:hypothetical protein Kpho02_72410 [Kitasatospora phosalacinea]